MKALAEQISDIDGVNVYGRVVGVRGLMVEIAGPVHAMSVGARIVIDTGGNRFIPSEVIGFTGNNAVVMPFAGLEGVRRGCRAVIANAASQVRPSPLWLGRVLNAMGSDRRQGPLPQVPRRSPTAMRRRRRIRASASASRSISTCAPYLRDLLPRPAARHLRRFGRRPIPTWRS
jgi:flagellum-specific ATP synthase